MVIYCIVLYCRYFAIVGNQCLLYNTVTIHCVALYYITLHCIVLHLIYSIVYCTVYHMTERLNSFVLNLTWGRVLIVFHHTLNVLVYFLIFGKHQIFTHQSWYLHPVSVICVSIHFLGVNSVFPKHKNGVVYQHCARSSYSISIRAVIAIFSDLSLIKIKYITLAWKAISSRAFRANTCIGS